MYAASYYTMVGEAMKQNDEELNEEMQAAIAEILRVSAGFYDRFAVHVGFTARGIEISGEVALAD